VDQNDWLGVINAGKSLQVRMLFASGTFNLSALPLYIKKGYSLIKSNITNRFLP
jgi:hypothetical protein